MPTLAEQQIKGVRTTDDDLVVDFSDGRTVEVPLTWYPRLLESTPEQRADWRLIGGGHGIHWPQIDEDLSAEGLLRGIADQSAHRPKSSHELASRQALNAAKELYEVSLESAMELMGNTRSNLRELRDMLPETQGSEREQLQDLIDALSGVQNSLDEARISGEDPEGI